MINITTNIQQVNTRLFKRLAKVASQPNLDALAREIAFHTVGQMRTRIHEKGQDSSGSQIGTYTPEYMRVRQQLLPPKYVRGKKKGQPRDYGDAKPRTADTKVVLSLSKQMEDDMKAGPIKTSDGYGVGFTNPFNYQKSQWNEATYKKPIFSLTQQEKAEVRLIAEDFINRLIGTI